jgi:predicted nucleic acid-binding Zn ribbon protein
MGKGRPRGKLEPLGPLVGKLLEGLGLDKRLREFRAVEAWEEAVGKTVSEHATPTGIREGVLFVEVDSSVWMQELSLLRESIVERLNAALGVPLVRRIVLSLERKPPERRPSATKEE